LRSQQNLSRESYDVFFDQTYDMEDQTCLIVGFGQIAKRLARACKALGMRINAINRNADPDNTDIEEFYQLSELTDAVRDADYVVNLLPLTPQTNRIFDKSVFMAMKPTAHFINVGRGESVIEVDLIDALKSGVIAGAGLDVFEKEPLSSVSELWDLRQVIITPHIGGLTNRYWDKQRKLFEENLRRYASRQALQNIVDMGKGY
jgi:phosphoglycerate dehydrogenase-like enzyme